MSEDIPRAVHALPEAGRDYSRKRRTSEGVRKRKIKESSPKTDAQLDAENALVWRRVSGSLADYGRADPLRDKAHDARAWNSYVRGAAFAVCILEFEIPASRVAELAGVSRQPPSTWKARYLRDLEMRSFVARWKLALMAQGK